MNFVTLKVRRKIKGQKEQCGIYDNENKETMEMDTNRMPKIQ